MSKNVHRKPYLYSSDVEYASMAINDKHHN